MEGCVECGCRLARRLGKQRGQSREDISKESRWLRAEGYNIFWVSECCHRGRPGPARGLKSPFTCTTRCTEDHAAASCKAFCNLNQEAKKKAVEDRRLCGFCLRHLADTECLGKGTVSKPARKFPECKGQHAESLHEMMVSAELAVNSVIYEKGEEEGFVNLARVNHDQEDGNGWRTPNDSWLDMEEEENAQVFHINVILEEDNNKEGMEEETIEEEEVQLREKKRGSYNGGYEARRRRPKRSRVCEEGVDWERLKLDAEIRGFLSSDTSEDDLE